MHDGMITWFDACHVHTEGNQDMNHVFCLYIKQISVKGHDICSYFIMYIVVKNYSSIMDILLQVAIACCRILRTYNESSGRSWKDAKCV